MTKEEFLKKLRDIDCSYLAPITKEMEEYMSKYSDIVVTPGKVGEKLGSIEFKK